MLGIINGTSCIQNPAMHIICARVSYVRAGIAHVTTNGKTSNCDICKHDMIIHVAMYYNDLNNGACRFR